RASPPVSGSQSHLHYRCVVAELGGETGRGLEARIREQPDKDHTVDPVDFELLIQIGVGKAAEGPMLPGEDVAWVGPEFRADLAAPGTVFAYLASPVRSVHRRKVLPRLIVTRPVPVMQSVEDTQTGLAR